MRFPGFVLTDILDFSSRLDLETAQMCCRSFQQSIDTHYSLKPLRKVSYVDFEEQKTEEMVFALKHSFIDKCELLYGAPFIDVCKILAELKPYTMISVLSISQNVDISGLDHGMFEKLLTDSVPISEVVCDSHYNLKLSQFVTNSLLKKCAEKGVQTLDFGSRWSYDEDSKNNCIDDGILEFCFGETPALEGKPRKLVVELYEASRDFFLRLVKASEESKITAPLRLMVNNVSIDGQNLGEHKPKSEKSMDRSGWHVSGPSHAREWTFAFPTHSLYTEVIFSYDIDGGYLDWVDDLYLTRGFPPRNVSDE
ncbi:hypothetical protein DdX_20222 [Ditylenchus destructor]|uniref:F-box domain-containing protein n=1 Tax=Ditylenchus destructor TaxID=166010 RepID=A0AAD4MID5_9BILA|nr:hypothetical protein DdX_20222 [Ditylenchus destructor]